MDTKNFYLAKGDRHRVKWPVDRDDKKRDCVSIFEKYLDLDLKVSPVWYLL